MVLITFDMIDRLKNYIFDFQLCDKDGSYEQECYEKIIGKQAKIYKFQYFHIENMLTESFSYIYPSADNSKTYSTKFASIIKEAGNLYEIICKDLYSNLPGINKKDMNIWDFLRLERILNLRDKILVSHIIDDDFDNEAKQPFMKLAKLKWDVDFKLQEENKPEWWTAYNKIKHDNEGLKTYATLINSIAAVGALFLYLNKLYGPGMVMGDLQKPYNGSCCTLFPVQNTKIWI